MGSGRDVAMPFLEKPLNDRQRKAGGFSRACLRESDQVTPVQREGYRLLLNRRRIRVTRILDRAQQLGHQAKIGKAQERRPGQRLRRIGRSRRQPLLSRFFRSEEHTSELQSQSNLVCRLLLEKKKKKNTQKKNQR